MELEKLEYYYFNYLPKIPFGVLEILSGFIPIIFGLIFFKPLINQYKVLFYYAVAIFLLELIASLLSAFSKNNHQIYIIFYIIESILLGIFFVNEVKNRNYTIMIILIISIIVVVFIINVFSPRKLMNDYSGAIQSFGFIVISLINYYFILGKLNIMNLQKSVLFWINSASFIYFSGKISVSLFVYELFDGNGDNLKVYWFIVSVVLVVNRILIAIGISQTKNTFRAKNSNFLK